MGQQPQTGPWVSERVGALMDPFHLFTSATVQAQEQHSNPVSERNQAGIFIGWAPGEMLQVSCYDHLI